MDWNEEGRGSRDGRKREIASSGVVIRCSLVGMVHEEPSIGSRIQTQFPARGEWRIEGRDLGSGTVTITNHTTVVGLIIYLGWLLGDISSSNDLIRRRNRIESVGHIEQQYIYAIGGWIRIRKKGGGD